MWTFIYYLALTLLTIALQPRPEKPKAASVEDFEVPTADENRSRPVLYGLDDITGPNVIYYGHLKVKKIKKRSGFKKVTVGYKYYLGMHFALSYQVDELREIRVGDRQVWAGSLSSGAGTISKSDIFGGKDREGGIEGSFAFLAGGSSQGVDSYLASRFGSQCPAFRGGASFVWKRGYVGTTPYLKNWAFRLYRTAIKPDGTPQWYAAKASIGTDMNPAHIIRECFTERYAMGYPEASINDAELTAAADTLFDEGFGLSMQWVRSEPINEFVDRILEIIGGVRTEDKTTASIGIKLIRDDYDPDLLDLIDESQIVSVDRFERRAWGDEVNQIQVVYYDPATRKETVVTVEDSASIERLGKPVPQKLTYKSIRSYDLAKRVGARELKTISAPVTKATLTFDRNGKRYARGGLFRYAPARVNLPPIVFRIMEMSHDESTGYVTMEVIEDIFSLPDTVYLASQPSIWTDPITAPVAVATQQAIEASYWDVIRDHEAGIIAGYPADFGIAHLMAISPQADAYAYDLLTVDANPGTNPYVYIEEAPYTPSATLTAGISRTAVAAIPIENGDGIDDVEIGSVAYIGDEMVVINGITLINDAEATLDVGRGVVDTVPVAHLAGERIWFPNDTYYGESGVESTGETIYMKAITKNSQGELDEAGALEATVVLDQRYQRPYPPGLIRFNGSAWPSVETGDLVITWAHRDRISQGTSLADQDQASIGPEAGTTYTIRIIDPTGPTTAHTEAGLSGTTWTYTQVARQADFGGVGPHDIMVEIESLRDGLTSRQMHSFNITVNDV